MFLSAMLTVPAFSGMAFASEDAEESVLREEAAVRLERASLTVEEAAREKALWIPAREALEEAKTAFSHGDYEQAISLAATAQRFAELGLMQVESPPYRHQ